MSSKTLKKIFFLFTIFPSFAHFGGFAQDGLIRVKPPGFNHPGENLPNLVKLECVPKFCYLGDTLGAGGGVEETSRATVWCAWATFNQLSPVLAVRGASYRIKGKIYKACVQSALTYWTETWAMKKANLHSLEETERMKVEMDVWGVAEG